MKTEDITRLLHHREPYLMVERVTSIDQYQIEACKSFSGEEFFLQGHFPGAPIVPGAMLQEFCTQSAGVLMTKFYSPIDDYNSNETKGFAIGVLNKVEFAKYLDVVKPTSEIRCLVTLVEKQDALFKFSAKVFQGDKLKAKFKFNLAIISDEYLTGGE